MLRCENSHFFFGNRRKKLNTIEFEKKENKKYKFNFIIIWF